MARASSATESGASASIRKASPRLDARRPNTALNVSSNSRKSVPPGMKHNCRMFSSTDHSGRISSRYFGTPPVIDRMSNSSRDESLCPAMPNIATLSASDSSPTSRSRESLPTKPVLSRMFSAIHDETEPQRTRTRLSCFLRRLSHAVLRNPAKSGLRDPIHDISSRRTTVRPTGGIAASRLRNASVQFFARGTSVPVWSESSAQKFFRCARSVMPLRGGMPTMFMKRSAVRLANSSISVLLPMRLRPRHVTSEEVRLLQSWESAVNCSFLPTNIRVCSLKDGDTIP